jgi:putative phosphoribosyl transferase
VEESNDSDTKRDNRGQIMERETEHRSEERAVRISAGGIELEGNLGVVDGAGGVVLFAHGSGSGRSSPRNLYVASVLRQAGLSTLLIDLLTAEEEAVDLRTRQLRFDIVMLAERLVGATDWLRDNPDTQNMRIGYFGASTGAGAALVAAAERPDEVGAVVSRGGRPDLAGEALSRVEAPTLVIVGGSDVPVIGMNEEALGRMHVEKQLEIVAGATHLFEEVGALKEVSRLAAAWFRRYLYTRG